MWAFALAVTVVLLPCAVPQYNTQYDGQTPTVWHVNAYPGDPWWFPEQCRRDNHSSVCDPNGIISKQQANELDRVIQSVAKNTKCPCGVCAYNQPGYIIRVALMEQMAHILNDTDQIMDRLRNVKVFSYLLSRRWKLTGVCNETVLIVYSRADNLLYTQTGHSARGLLTDPLVVEISVDVRPFFEDRSTIADGLITMVRKYRDVFSKKYKRTSGEGASHTGGPTGGASFVTWSPLMLFVTLLTVFHS